MDNSIILKTLNMVIKNISNMVKYGHPKKSYEIRIKLRRTDFGQF